jgi:hypothetical protein
MQTRFAVVWCCCGGSSPSKPSQGVSCLLPCLRTTACCELCTATQLACKSLVCDLAASKARSTIIISNQSRGRDEADAQSLSWVLKEIPGRSAPFIAKFADVHILLPFGRQLHSVPVCQRPSRTHVLCYLHCCRCANLLDELDGYGACSTPTIYICTHALRIINYLNAKPKS